ncbi:MAG: glycoside hydrolase family 13 protein [Cyclobacteriaceae bacterium]
MNKVVLFLLVVLSCNITIGQQLDRVEPPFWWAGMVNNQLQLMVHGERISELTPSFDYPGVKLVAVTKLENPNYLILDLNLDMDVQPGAFDIQFRRGKKTVKTYVYELKARRAGSADRIGFNTSDVMYLITPDRFVNGDPSNDNVDGMREQANRSFKGGRHGGDIAGMIKSLDYIDEMGFTAIWVNPVLENDMNEYSYHGYSTTDFYKVDPRFGTNEDYAELSQMAKDKGIKVIMDMIVNHSGSEHWWMKDLPSSNWVNFQDDYLMGEYKITSHRKPVVQDPYASKIDRKDFTDGWFVTTMPDLNQRNPYMAKYLTQNSIWWIEYADLSGIRMDTYPYPDMNYMTEWTCAVMSEYPNFNVVGEEWFSDPSIVSYWQRGKVNPNGYTSCLPSLMDFPLQSKLSESLNAPNGEWAGWLEAYTTLANDFVYADASNLVVFPDNHDMSRFFTQINENFDLFKLGIAYYMTIRGVPQIYYGTEILMNNPGTTDHGIIRSDFPGGWDGDKVNAFTGEGLTSMQKEAQEFIRNLLNWRKDNKIVHTGKLLHYVPKDDIYVLIRYNEVGKVVTILSKRADDFELSLDRFSEVLNGNESGIEVISGQPISLEGKVIVPAMQALILDVK